MPRQNTAVKIREIAESSRDPRDALIRAVGPVDEVLHSQVLIATYIRPAVTKGGILLADRTLQEDEFKGSIGLVFGIGPGAFCDDGIAKFHGVKLKLHDWVLFRPADGLALALRSVPCRLFEDANIKMRVKNPADYW